jgi:hypothetical protein
VRRIVCPDLHHASSLFPPANIYVELGELNNNYAIIMYLRTPSPWPPLLIEAMIDTLIESDFRPPAQIESKYRTYKWDTSRHLTMTRTRETRAKNLWGIRNGNYTPDTNGPEHCQSLNSLQPCGTPAEPDLNLSHVIAIKKFTANNVGAPTVVGNEVDHSPYL